MRFKNDPFGDRGPKNDPFGDRGPKNDPYSGASCAVPFASGCGGCDDPAGNPGGTSYCVTGGYGDIPLAPNNTAPGGFPGAAPNSGGPAPVYLCIPVAFEGS
ncbi:hypothetical protein EON79_06990 [bacterium]|nr:MAG: hypothetical protein EON79_06990 [bacterium]